MVQAPAVSLDEHFSGHPESRALFEAVRDAVAAFGPVELRVTKSQVAFRRRRGFAYTWIPGRYLGGTTPPLVLSIDLGRRDPSARWKEVVEPAPGRFMHHLELHRADEIDDEVAEWLREARTAADGSRGRA